MYECSPKHGTLEMAINSKTAQELDPKKKYIRSLVCLKIRLIYKKNKHTQNSVIISGGPICKPTSEAF